MAIVAAPEGYNYDEEKLPAYTLPDALKADDGTVVSTAEQWNTKRRAEVMAVLEKHEYGKSPPRPREVKFRITEPATPVFDGLGLRQQVFVSFTDKPDGPGMDVLMYLPAKPGGPAPLFWGLNFEGNHGVSDDPAVPLCRSWMNNSKKTGVTANKPTEQSRGSEKSRYPLREILSAGYGVATAYYGDIDPDFDDGFKNGVHALFPEVEAARAGDTWGSVASWAWGLSLGMDYFAKDPKVDAARVFVMGHSRLGKTSLWAGANDARFALVISNDSGCGGAALHKRIFGETVARINTSFPHWFCRNFRAFNDKEDTLTFDQHFLIAAIAPRPVLVCSATKDLWADPKGEFLAALHAAPVYKLLGRDGLAATEQPPPDKLIDSTVGYHLRTGEHDVTLEDWKAYIQFANKHFPRK